MTKKQEVKLTRNEENSMIYDLDFYWIEMENKAYTIGCVPVQSRLAKIRGKRDTYYTMVVDQKGYKIYRKTHDLRKAEWSLAHAPYFDHFQETFKTLKSKQQQKGTMNLSVKNGKRNKTTNDPILKIVYGLDLKHKENDDETTYRAKMALASIRPRDFEVVLIPDTLPELP